MDAAFDLSLRSYGDEQAAHSHPHHQIILALSGALEVETGRGGGLVDGTSVAVVPAGLRHAYRGVGANSFVILDADVDRATRFEPLWQAADRHPFLALDPALAGLRSFAREAYGRLAGDRGLRLSLAELVLDGLAGTAATTRRGEPAGLVRARAVMRRNLARPVRLGDIARDSGLSLATLHRYCKEWHGLSPARLLARMRLDEARAMLSHGSKPLCAIAQACGYSEQSALSRAFHREFGLSPGAWRRQHQAPN